MKSITIVLIIIICVSVLMTFPLAFKVDKYIPGFFSTNESYNQIWNSWRIKHTLESGLSSKNETLLIAYPFGISLVAVYSTFCSEWLFNLLSLVTSPAVTFNLIIFVNFILSAFVTYLLTLFVTKNKLSALFSAIVFGFSPYQFSRAWQHIGLTYNEFIPLILFSAFILKDKPSKLSGLFLVLSIVSLFSFDYSVAYFGGVAFVIFILYSIIYSLFTRSKDSKTLDLEPAFFSSLVFCMILAFLMLLPQFQSLISNRPIAIENIKNYAFNPLLRNFDDLFAQSAKPLSYLLPPATHPIFGSFTERMIGSALYGGSFTEHTLFLGLIPLVLTFILIKNLKRIVSKKDSFYIGFFIVLGLTSWLFSQPPWWNIFGYKIYMPSYFMYKIIPMYRAYCRFGIVVMLAISVLAGFGLRGILDRQKNSHKKLFITVLFCSLVLFEFWSWPSFKVIDVSKAPKVYYWLREQPADTVIAEYPLDADSPNEMYKFYQITHNKKIINGTVPGSVANDFANTITKLSEGKTAKELQRIGVKFVIVHKEDYERTELLEMIEEFKNIPRNPYLKFVRSFPAQECPEQSIPCTEKTGEIDVYQILSGSSEASGK